MDNLVFNAYIYAMPKKPRFIHPVRAVRCAIAKSQGRMLSQPAFAKLVGTSPATIQSVELGRLSLSPKLANRICVATGADPYSLLGRHARPRDILGRPYTPESFGITKYKRSLEGRCEEVWKPALLYMEALLRASDATRNSRLFALLLSFDTWLQTARKEFGLQAESSRILRELTERPDPEARKTTWMEWTTAAFAVVAERGNVLLAQGKPSEAWARDDIKPGRRTHGRAGGPVRGSKTKTGQTRRSKLR